MEFNSNDEYLKAFPPNFSPKIERPKKVRVLSDLEVSGIPPKDPQENVEAKPMALLQEPVCVEAQCMEVPEPNRVDRTHTHNIGDETLAEEQEEVLLLKQDLAPAEAGMWDQPCLPEPAEFDEPMPQMVEMALVVQAQTDDEMVEMALDGEGLEAMLSVEAIEEIALDAKALGDSQVKELLPAEKLIEDIAVDAEPICSVEAKVSTLAVNTVGHIGGKQPNLVADATYTNIGDTEPTLAIDASGHFEAEKSIATKNATEAAGMEAEMFEPLTLSAEIVETTTLFTEFERPLIDTNAVQGNAMEREVSDYVEYEQPTVEIQVLESSFITDEATDPYEFEGVCAVNFSEETCKDADAVRQIEVKENVTVEVIEKTTIIKVIPLSQISPKLSAFTPVTAETSGNSKMDAAAIGHVGTEEQTLAFEVIEKTTIKAKGICQDEGEHDDGPRFTMEVVESTRTSITALDEELGTCSDEYVDKIVDRIMNDIAGIEADMNAGFEADIVEAGIESNIQHQKVSTYEKPVRLESEETCQDHVQPSGGHG